MVDPTKVKLGKSGKGSEVIKRISDPIKLKLGKLPPVIRANRLMFSKYVTYKLGPILPSVDYTMGVTEFGMMLNGPNNYTDPNLTADQLAYIREGLGDCVIAALLHLEQILTANTGNYMMTLPDACGLQKYEQWGGFDPSDPYGTDNGMDEANALDHYLAHPGLWKHSALAYADPSHTDLVHCQKALELFGGLYIGVALPVSAQGSKVWAAAHGDWGIPGSWGLHAVTVPKYETSLGRAMVAMSTPGSGSTEVRFFAISWGELYEITQQFWVGGQARNPYVDEVHAVLGADWLRWKGMPEGFDLNQLLADQKQIIG